MVYSRYGQRTLQPKDGANHFLHQERLKHMGASSSGTEILAMVDEPPDICDCHNSHLACKMNYIRPQRNSSARLTLSSRGPLSALQKAFFSLPYFHRSHTCFISTTGGKNLYPWVTYSQAGNLITPCDFCLFREVRFVHPSQNLFILKADYTNFSRRMR